MLPDFSKLTLATAAAKATPLEKSDRLQKILDNAQGLSKEIAKNRKGDPRQTSPQNEEGPSWRPELEFSDDPSYLGGIQNGFFDQDGARYLTSISKGELITGGDPVEKEVVEKRLTDANRRLNQCYVLLGFLEGSAPDVFSLNPAEVITAKRAVRAACVEWAKQGALQDAMLGSALFWTCAIALQMVAMRPDGFAMPTEELRQLATLDGLYTYLKTVQGTRVMTDESDMAATKAGRGVQGAQRYTEAEKYRRARVDNLGNQNQREMKMDVLNEYVTASHFFDEWDDEKNDKKGGWKGVGLAPQVLTMETPGLLPVTTRPPGKITMPPSRGQNEQEMTQEELLRQAFPARLSQRWEAREMNRGARSTLYDN
tara:strand:+ start:71 stop:1180 length:1110 start_codon:yes stop_codon:yes gene_type:complete